MLYLFVFLGKLSESAISKTKASQFNSTPAANSLLGISPDVLDDFLLMQLEKKKAGQGDDCHGNPEIDRLRKEVQDTKEINKKLRDLLQVQSSSSKVVCTLLRRFSL